MKYFKKILALFMALMCIATVCAVSASAKTASDGKSTYQISPIPAMPNRLTEKENPWHTMKELLRTWQQVLRNTI